MMPNVELDRLPRRQCPLMIEFAGASCTGKSTLIRRLQSELHAEGFDPLAVKAALNERPRDFLLAVARPGIAGWCLLNPVLSGRSKGRRLLGAIGCPASALMGQFWVIEQRRVSDAS